MAALNGYSNASAVNDADEFVIWQSGAVLNVLWSVLKTVIAGLYHSGVLKAAADSLGLTVTGVMTDSQDAANVGEGGDVTIADGVSAFIHTGTAARTAATIRLPANPKHNQVVNICSAGVITTLTLTGASGSTYTINGAITTIAANGYAAYRYRSNNTTWYRCG